MTLPLTHRHLATGLFSHWADQFPLDVPTIYPGTQLDTAPLEAWLEIWLDAWSRRPQRAAGPLFLDLIVTVHCFSKPGSDTARAPELAEAARATLSERTIPLRDFEESGQPLVGYASLFEADLRDLTRNHLDSLRSPLHHVVLTCPGLAQPL